MGSAAAGGGSARSSDAMPGVFFWLVLPRTRSLLDGFVMKERLGGGGEWNAARLI